MIGLFAKNTQANTRRREREGNKPAERSVLILARKLRKTKEACRNSAPLRESADRSSPGLGESVPSPPPSSSRPRKSHDNSTTPSTLVSTEPPILLRFQAFLVRGGERALRFHVETRSSREERRAKKKKEKKTAVHSTRRAFTRVFEEERGGWRWRKWRPEEVRERGPFVEMPSVPLFAEAGEASLEHRIIAAVPARIPERKGSSWFSPGAVYRLPEKKPRLSLETGGTLRASPLTFSANLRSSPSVVRQEEGKCVDPLIESDRFSVSIF